MAEYDLTSIIIPHLDRHLIFPLLENLHLYSEEDIMRAKIELLSKTNMVDFAKEIYKKLHQTEAVPQDMEKRREEIFAKFQSLQQEVAPLMKLLNDTENINLLKEQKLFTAQYLLDNYNIKPETIEALYRYAKFQYDCGSYGKISDSLTSYRLLTSSGSEKNYSALWGKFSSEILMQNWERALEDMNRLKEIIDQANKEFANQKSGAPMRPPVFFTPQQQLTHRTWLIHWSLFVFFNAPNGRNAMIELFLQSDQTYLNVVQTSCPHILRYLVTALITNKRRRQMKDLARIIQQEAYHYRDPLTEFLECLDINFDFEGAQQKLKECEIVLSNDFFLVACKNEFLENARLFIFENYCRIHQCIDIGMMAQKLNMDEESAEKWIVNLIRNARLPDAKIDSAANQVIIGPQNPSIYQQVIEKTKGLCFRTYVLANNVERRQQSAHHPHHSNPHSSSSSSSHHPSQRHHSSQRHQIDVGSDSK